MDGTSAGIIGALALLVGGASADTQVAEKLKTRLPKTAVTKIDCKKIDGLCEVQAGKNLFYVDKSSRYLVVGRVYDMETRQDLTAAKLLEMNPDMLIGGAASSEQQAERQEQQDSQQASAKVARTADVSKLSAKGAIVWGSGSQKVTVFSDFNCSYCRALKGELEALNVTVVERPISVLGTRAKSDLVICARDQKAALKAAYDGGNIVTTGTCDTSGLDENEKFARAHGFNGTPVLVRQDGAVLEGFRPRAALEAWLKGSRG